MPGSLYWDAYTLVDIAAFHLLIFSDSSFDLVGNLPAFIFFLSGCVALVFMKLGPMEVSSFTSLDP